MSHWWIRRDHSSQLSVLRSVAWLRAMSGLALWESLFCVLLSLGHGFIVHSFPGNPGADDILCQWFASLMPCLYFTRQSHWSCTAAVDWSHTYSHILYRVSVTWGIMRPAKHWYVEVADKSFLHPQSHSDQNVRAWTLVVLILAFSYKKWSMREWFSAGSQLNVINREDRNVFSINVAEMIMIMGLISIYAVVYTHYTRIGNLAILFFSTSSLHFTFIRISISVSQPEKSQIPTRKTFGWMEDS